MSERTTVQSQTAVKSAPAPVASGLLQRAAINSSLVNEVPPIVHEVLRSPGQPLNTATRAFMEPRFGHDFSGVQVHTDPQAARSARLVNARAYTVGRDLVFDAGQFAPQTSTGQRLLAHELAHVVQQGNSEPYLQRLVVGHASNDHEVEAEQIAAATLSVQPVSHPTFMRSSSVAGQLQRACAVSIADLAVCTESTGQSIFDVGESSESLFLFDEGCDLRLDYAMALAGFASSLGKNIRIVIHGFSSNQEGADYACQRAVLVRDKLLENGVDADQVDAIYYHSAVAGDPDMHRSAVIEKVGTLAVRPAPTATAQEADEPRPAREERQPIATTASATPTSGGAEYTGPGWKSLNQLGIVRVEEASATVRGARLRPATSTSTSFNLLEENTRVFVIAENPQSKWSYVNVTDKQHRGSSGYVSTPLVWRGPPDPEAQLHYVAEKGLGLQKLVENHPQYADYDIRTGDDARSIVMAVLIANDQDKRTKGNVYLNETKFAAAQDPGLWEGIKDKADEYRRVLRPMLQSVELLLDKKIWLPGKSYIAALKSKDIIPTRSGWKNAAIAATKGIGGFLAGLVDGFFSSIIDVFVGIYDLIKQIISTAMDLISGEAIRKAKEFIDTLSEMTADELLTLLKNAVTAIIGDLFNNFANRWNANNTYSRWNFRGGIVGYVLAEVLMAIFSGGSTMAVKWLGKLGKLGSKLATILTKVLHKVDTVLDRVPGRKRRDKVDVHHDKGDSPDKAKQLPLALTLASTIAEGHDTGNSPVSLALASLLPLKARFRWIKGFKSQKISRGHYRLVMLGSEYAVDSDYTTEVEEEFAEASKKGTPTDQPKGFEDLDVPSRTEKQAGVRVAEEHHVLTKYRNENKELFRKIGFKVDDDFNLIKDFKEHGELRGWYKWDPKKKVYVPQQKGHHPEYNNWVTQRVKSSIKGLRGKKRQAAFQSAVEEIASIVEKHPDVLAYGPRIFERSNVL